jgi:hypothetical protein
MAIEGRLFKIAPEYPAGPIAAENSVTKVFGAILQMALNPVRVH